MGVHAHTTIKVTSYSHSFHLTRAFFSQIGLKRTMIESSFWSRTTGEKGVEEGVQLLKKFSKGHFSCESRALFKDLRLYSSICGI